jgi:hypothetical protein
MEPFTTPQIEPVAATGPFTTRQPEDSCMSSTALSTRAGGVFEVCMPMAAPEGNEEPVEEEPSSVVAELELLQTGFEQGIICESDVIEGLEVMHLRGGDILRPEDFPPVDEIAPWLGSDSEGPDERSPSCDEDAQTKGSGFPATPDPSDAGIASFEFLPNHAALTGRVANIRFFHGHGVSSQEDIERWHDLELACNDAGPHKLAVYGEPGNPDDPISVHHLGPTGMYEQIHMTTFEILGGSPEHFFQLPSDFPDFPTDCDPVQVDVLLRALGARDHSDTITSYY